jgi:hypothetical protein
VKGSSILAGLFLLVTLPIARPAELLSGSAEGVRAVNEPRPSLKLSNARVTGDGTLDFQAERDGPGKVMIESSTDLKEWTNDALGEGNGIFSFPDTTWRGPQRFYRARDFLHRISGIVRHIQTEEPWLMPR